MAESPESQTSDDLATIQSLTRSGPMRFRHGEQSDTLRTN